MVKRARTQRGYKPIGLKRGETVANRHGYIERNVLHGDRYIIEGVDKFRSRFVEVKYSFDSRLGPEDAVTKVTKKVDRDLAGY